MAGALGDGSFHWMRMARGRCAWYAMIVRINQLDVNRAEASAGWESAGPGGVLRFAWPAGTLAFEILILEQDEQQRRLEDGFRQHQLRQLIAQLADSLKAPDEELVLRLDGPFAHGELARGLHYLTDPRGYGRFAVSPMAKHSEEPGEIPLSVRIQVRPPRLAAICTDPAIGLCRSVQFRLMGLPLDQVGPMLDAEGLADDRWPEILHEAGFMLTAAQGLTRLILLTRRLDASAVRELITHTMAYPKDLPEEL